MISFEELWMADATAGYKPIAAKYYVASSIKKVRPVVHMHGTDYA